MMQATKADLKTAFTDPDDIAIDFQGIELKDMPELQECRKQIFAPLVEKLVPVTSVMTCTPLRVYVQQGNKPIPIITFHDIGTNHESFRGFFNFDEMRVLLEHFTVYHICAPGHQCHAPTLTASLIESEAMLTDARNPQQPPGRNSGSISSSSSNFQYPTMEQLAEMVQCVLNHFNLKRVVGFGKGAGANILVRHALKYPNRMIGLFLINPTCTQAGYVEWFKARWSDIPQLQKGFITDGLKTLLENQWFGWGKADNEDLCEQLHHEMRQNLNLTNIAGYINSFICRSEIPLVRPTVPPSATPAQGVLNVDSMLVSGDLAQDLCNNMVEMNGRMDPSKAQFISMTDATGMLLDEIPEKVTQLFLGFLRNVGLVVTLTPEMLRERAHQLRSKLSAMAMMEVVGGGGHDIPHSGDVAGGSSRGGQKTPSTSRVQAC